MRAYILIMGLISLAIIAGCTGGGLTPLGLSDIQGPATVNERASAQYSVDATGDPNATFQWLIEPDTVGYLTDDISKTVTLHTYELTQTTTAKLTVVASVFKLGPVQQSIQIQVIDSNQPPVAAASCDRPKIGDGQSVQFTDESDDPNGYADIYNWEWDFSYVDADGFQPESLVSEPLQQFPDPGTFDVQLRVTDSAGHTDMLDEPLTIEVVTNTAPAIMSINRSGTTSHGGSGDSVMLDVGFSDPLPDDDTHTFLWSCTDGTFDSPTDSAVSWFPPPGAAMTDIGITVRVTDWYGLYDEAFCKLWATSLPDIDNPNATDNEIIARSLDSVFNGTVDPADFKFPDAGPDGNVVLLAFWASWASASVADMPALVDIYDTYRDMEYVQICINVGEDATAVEYFVNSNSYEASYWLLDPDASYYELCNDWADDASCISMYLLFDRDGHCRWAFAGALTPTLIDSLEAAIEELL